MILAVTPVAAAAVVAALILLGVGIIAWLWVLIERKFGDDENDTIGLP